MAAQCESTASSDRMDARVFGSARMSDSVSNSPIEAASRRSSTGTVSCRPGRRTDSHGPRLPFGKRAVHSYDYAPISGTYWMHSHVGMQEQVLMTAP